MPCHVRQDQVEHRSYGIYKHTFTLQYCVISFLLLSISTCSAPALFSPGRDAHAAGTPPVTVPQMLKLYVKFCSTTYIGLNCVFIPV